MRLSSLLVFPLPILFRQSFRFFLQKEGRRKNVVRMIKLGQILFLSTKFANSRFRLEISKIVIRENNWNRDLCFIIEKDGLKNIKKNSEKRFRR